MELKSNKIMSQDMPKRGIFQRFRKDEDGALIIFSLMMMVMILWFGGMAVDLMRYETTRAKLQGSLDRATLAAADLDQVMAPADVVRDYMDKAGMLHFLQGDPIVDQGINYRIVTANASAPMPLFFYDLPKVFSSPFTPGMSSLTVSGSSTAEERVSDVEISLVLDVSSSMNSNNRMTNLRPAAREFVTTVLANNTNAPQGLITISMIPYSAVVNPGTDIAPHLNINRTHEYSTCPMFDDTEFTTTALNLGASYDHVSHFSYGGSNDMPINPNYTWCFAGDLNAIKPHTTNEADLHTAINNLHAYGNTAIDMGVKWGVALLDSSTQSLISSLAGASGTGVPAIANGRPELHTQADVLKVLVLMTDGQNTQQWDLVEPYKSGMSPVWFDLDDVNQPLWDVDFNKTSVQYQGEATNSRWDDWFYWNGYSGTLRYRDYPNGFNSRLAYVNASPVDASGPGEGTRYVDNGDELYHASWQQLFADRSYFLINNHYFLDAYYAGAWSWNEYWGTDNSIDHLIVNGSEANTRLSNICAAARAQGIVIYTVAFEAPSGGQTALQDCASSSSHYFDVDGTDISGAFSAIASDIRNLKLTQ
ncbi:hypothetical protein OAN307_c11270 [Octadecabacter antarcticus 307]|uniref:Putative Flp pilus-assembly TadG-like N-terminal domain-containing protein n=1 Tax=Octadecabacter antarcticus 307 TaxID=391626 RepID=M9R2E8_9RHOB|nr:TadE/TadG family type IV pilus assembly protein [Octadecabacter antarcticus]AGI66829.1 hypothetical protein OAN307_c11270 [Octadecabacter antarcticus 307]